MESVDDTFLWKIYPPGGFHGKCGRCISMENLVYLSLVNK